MENIKELKVVYKDGSEMTYDYNGFSCKKEGEASWSHVLINSDAIKGKIEKCAVEKAGISELKCCDKISMRDTDKYSFVSYVGDDDFRLECDCYKDEKSVYEQILEYSVDILSDELWETFEEAEDEETLCLECLVRYYLEKAYSYGYQEGIRHYKQKVEEASQSIEDELLFEVAKSGYSDDE